MKLTCPHLKVRQSTSLEGKTRIYLTALQIDPESGDCEVCRKLLAFDALLKAAKLMLGYGPGQMPDGRDTYDVLSDAIELAEGGK